MTRTKNKVGSRQETEVFLFFAEALNNPYMTIHLLAAVVHVVSLLNTYTQRLISLFVHIIKYILYALVCTPIYTKGAQVT